MEVNSGSARAALNISEKLSVSIVLPVEIFVVVAGLFAVALSNVKLIMRPRASGAWKMPPTYGANVDRVNIKVGCCWARRGIWKFCEVPVWANVRVWVFRATAAPIAVSAPDLRKKRRDMDIQYYVSL